MKLFVQCVELIDVTVLGGEPLAHQERGERIDPVLLVEPCCQAHGTILDAFAHDLAFDNVLEFDQAHGGARVGLDRDQFLIGQLQHRFAQRGSGNIQLCAQLLLADHVPRLQSK
ncbi:hypothetical protein D3C72_1965160 [compost metagenome]